MHSLDDGICDAVFTRSFTKAAPDIYDSLTLDYDRFVLVLPENHPLANKEKLDLAELKDETFFQLGNKRSCSKRYENFVILVVLNRKWAIKEIVSISSLTLLKKKWVFR